MTREDTLGHLNGALQGRYRIERELGEGGMATVYLADDLRHARKVAVKVLKTEVAASVGSDRFLAEIKTTANLQHPHILPLFDSGEAEGFLFYVMPFVEGESLRERIDRERQLPIDDALDIALEVADALSYAHDQGMVHRDIKPDNIMLTRNHALVADFGIGRALDVAGGERLTQTGTTIGTPTYMGPEQWDDASEVDGRADIYALGCTLYEMLVGQPPFSGSTRMAIMARHTFDAVPSPSVQRPTIPVALESALLRSLAKVPADRYRTVSDFLAALKTVRSSDATLLTGAGGARPRKRERRHLIAAGTAALLLLLGVALYASGFEALTALLPLDSGGRPRGGVVGGTLPPNRIAVLYFDDLSQDASLGFVADALTESLIDELALVPALSVLSRDGAERFRHPAMPIDSLARIVGAGTVVRGSVRRTEDDVRVDVAIADGESGAEFRRGTFRVAEANLLAARVELVEEVARLLREWLGEEITLRGVRGSTTSVSAWALFQRGERERKEGEWRLDEGDVDGFVEAFVRSDSLLAEAESQDSTWVRPPNLRARLAVTWAQLLANEPIEARAWIDQGMAHVGRVLSLEPTNAHALETRGILKYLIWSLDLEPSPAAVRALLPGAEQDLQASVRADPGRANAWNVLSVIHSEKPDLIQAKIAAQRAWEADSYLRAAEDVLWALYSTSYDLEQFADATNYCREGRRRFPANQLFVECELWLLSSRALDPDVQRAWTLADELIDLSPPQIRAYDAAKSRVLVGGVLARAAVVDSADAVLSRALADSADAVFLGARPGTDVDPNQELLGVEAMFRLQMGQEEEALQLLRVYLTANPQHRAGWRLTSHWWWRGLQDNQEFRELVGSGP